MKQGIICLSIGLVVGLYIGYKLPRPKPKQESEVKSKPQPEDEPIKFKCSCGSKIQDTQIAKNQHNKSKKHQNYLLTQE